tara:strand:+ start:83 stop:466 length:384 start_codon:yes stop_codon:yes gene_type:complete
LQLDILQILIENAQFAHGHYRSCPATISRAACESAEHVQKGDSRQLVTSGGLLQKTSNTAYSQHKDRLPLQSRWLRLNLIPESVVGERLSPNSVNADRELWQIVRYEWQLLLLMEIDQKKCISVVMA